MMSSSLFLNSFFFIAARRLAVVIFVFFFFLVVFSDGASSESVISSEAGDSSASGVCEGRIGSEAGAVWALAAMAEEELVSGRPRPSFSVAELSSAEAWATARAEKRGHVRLRLPLCPGSSRVDAAFEAGAADVFASRGMLVMRPWDVPGRAILVRWNFKSRLRPGFYEECGLSTPDEMIAGIGPSRSPHCRAEGLRDGRPMPDPSRALRVDPSAPLLGMDDPLPRRAAPSGPRTTSVGVRRAGSSSIDEEFEAWMALPGEASPIFVPDAR
jgi:hypothetical protein